MTIKKEKVKPSIATPSDDTWRLSETVSIAASPPVPTEDEPSVALRSLDAFDQSKTFSGKESEVNAAIRAIVNALEEEERKAELYAKQPTKKGGISIRSWKNRYARAKTEQERQKLRHELIVKTFDRIYESHHGRS